jgi:hypothetical protein
MTNLKKKSLVAALLFTGVSFSNCKPPYGLSKVASGDLGGANMQGVGFQQVRVILGYAGLAVVQSNNQFMFGGAGQSLASGTMLAVFDLNGNQISGIQVKRLQFLQTSGEATPDQNGVAALDMGTQGLPMYSLDIDIGDMYCSSLDSAAPLVVGVQGDLACFSKNTEQGRFVEGCLQPGGMGHVELNSTNPVCVSRVMSTYATPFATGALGRQRELTGDPMVLYFDVPQQREMVAYLPVYRQLQNVCDNPSMPSGRLTSQGMGGMGGMGGMSAYGNDSFDSMNGMSGQNQNYSDIDQTSISGTTQNGLSTGTTGQAAIPQRPLTYCQCRSQGGGLSRGGMPVTFDLLAESRRIYRNLVMWKGQQPSRDPLTAFQQACQDGTIIDLPIPPNISQEESNMLRNEALCGQLQNSGRATISQDRCLCSRNNRSNMSGMSSSYSSYNRPTMGGSQNIAVNFAVSAEEFLSQCLMISDSMTTKQFCDSNSMLRYSNGSNTDYRSQSSIYANSLGDTEISDEEDTESVNRVRSGCMGCPGQNNSAGVLSRGQNETVTTYALRCMGVPR